MKPPVFMYLMLPVRHLHPHYIFLPGCLYQALIECKHDFDVLDMIHQHGPPASAQPGRHQTINLIRLTGNISRIKDVESLLQSNLSFWPPVLNGHLS